MSEEKIGDLTAELTALRALCESLTIQREEALVGESYQKAAAYAFQKGRDEAQAVIARAAEHCEKKGDLFKRSWANRRGIGFTEGVYTARKVVLSILRRTK